MKPIHFEATITEPVYVRAQKVYSREQPGFWMSALAVGGVLFWRMSTEDQPPSSIAVRVISSLIVVMIVLGLMWWLLSFAFRYQYRRLAEIYRSMNVTIDDNGFQYVSPDGMMNFQWSQLKRAVIYPDFGLVYRTPAFFLIFDRHFFASEEEWLALVSAISERVPMKTRGGFLAPPR